MASKKRILKKIRLGILDKSLLKITDTATSETLAPSAAEDLLVAIDAAAPTALVAAASEVVVARPTEVSDVATDTIVEDTAQDFRTRYPTDTETKTIKSISARKTTKTTTKVSKTRSRKTGKKTKAK